jgi:hypothetical protein
MTVETVRQRNVNHIENPKEENDENASGLGSGPTRERPVIHGCGVMKHRLFRRGVGGYALISGITGIAANLSLAGFFALARPWGDPSSRWAWLGPANDITGAISMATLIPVVVYLGRRIPATRLLQVLAAGSVLAMGALALVAPLMLAGVVSLTVQFVVAGVGLPVIFGWLVVVNRAGRRSALLPGSVAAYGRIVGIAALAGTALAGAAAFLASGTTAQYVLLGLATMIGLPA